MNKIVNEIPHFQPFDICIVKKTGDLVVINQSSLNQCQSNDYNQWSYSIIPIDKSCKLHSAWYHFDELELVNNILEIIANKERKSDYKFEVPRRS